MWTYEQATGKFYTPDGFLTAFGYSGRADGKNNPEMQSVPNVGPIPEGIYSIGRPEDTLTHGPFVLPLTPDPSNQMFSRGGFLIHGDSIVAPGSASEGCIILPRLVRNEIAASLDRTLKVISGPFQAADFTDEAT
jgi:hypothetical protein